MHSSTIIVAALGVFATTVSSLGINCRGSSNCPLFHTEMPSMKVIDQIAAQISTVDDNRLYTSGQHVACVDGEVRVPIGLKIVTSWGSVCAFLQSAGDGMRGRNIKNLLPHLQQHGCKACGSVPTGFPGDNDVGHGQLTLNYVDRITNGDAPCRNGVSGKCSFD